MGRLVVLTEDSAGDDAAVASKVVWSKDGDQGKPWHEAVGVRVDSSPGEGVPTALCPLPPPLSSIALRVFHCTPHPTPSSPRCGVLV